MQKHSKLVTLVLLLLASFVLVTAVNAADFGIAEVKVNGVELAESSSIIHVNRGDNVDVRVELRGGETKTEDVRVKAWIGGYEYDEIEDVSEEFDMLANTTYVKYLTLQIPEDIDATKDYTLHVEAYTAIGDEIEYDDLKFTLRITPERHLLDIQDVIFNPGLAVEAGNPLYVKARVENLGENKERDIRVKAEIPELGVDARTYIDELVSDQYCDEHDCNDDDEVSATSSELMLKIPEDANGTYKLYVTVEYNKFHDKVEKSYTLEVIPKALPSVEEAAEVQRYVTVDATTKEVAQGKGVIYKFNVANLGTEAEIYSLDVTGLDDWASWQVDPESIVVQPDTTGEIYLYIAANEEATIGKHVFTVTLKSGEESIKEITLAADVKEAPKGISTEAILWIVFGVLIAAVIVLGIVLAVKSRKKEEKTEEPLETSSYY